MASALPAGISLTEPTPVLVTGILQSFLQGTICCQAARYWDSGYDGDSVLLRCFVGLVVLLSVLQTVLEDYKMWAVLIHGQIWDSRFISGAEEQGIFWTEPFLNGLIVSLCSGFLIRRCWKVTGKKNWILAVLGTVLLGLFATNTFESIMVGIGSRYMARLNKEQLRPLVIAWSVWSYGSFALDVILTAILTVYFWRSRTGLTSSNTVLFKLTAIAWETALLPAISMLTAISLYYSNRNEEGALNQIPYFFFVMTGKLYTVGFLRTLNVRTKLRERLQSQDLGRVSLGNWTWDQTTKNSDSATRGSIGSTLVDPTARDPSVTASTLSTENPFTSPHMVAQEQGLSFDMVKPL